MKDYADKIMNCFKWGHSFYPLNGELLNAYQECQSSTDVVKIQNEWIQYMENEKKKKSSANKVDDEDYFSQKNTNQNSQSEDDSENDFDSESSETIADD